MDLEVDIHPDLVWDYATPPRDPLWRLQRIADAFPAYGRDRRTVAQLFAMRHQLRMPPEVRPLIELYEEIAGLDLALGIEDCERTFGWPGLPFLLQTAFSKVDRLETLPETTPALSREELERFFRDRAKDLIRLDEGEDEDRQA